MASIAINWHLDDVMSTPKGAKLAPASSPDNQKCVWCPSAVLRAPFGLSSFDKSASPTRMNLDLILEDASVLREAEQLDEWAVNYLVENGERLFGRKMTEKQVCSSYVPCVRAAKDKRFAPSLKTKINRNGPNAIRFWDAEGRPAEEPTNWREIELKVKIIVSHAWFMNSQFGLTLLVTDAQISPRAPVQRDCPFFAES